MDIMIYDEELNAVHIIDSYESIIWTDRYCEFGDFELYTNIDLGIVQHIRQDRIITCPDSEHAMIVDKIQIKSDVENGSKLIITGKSLESILERRIIWGQKSYNGEFQDVISSLINDCIINPSDTKRRIPNFIFEKSDDLRFKGVNIKAQYTGDNLYEVVKALCDEVSAGFKVTLTEDGKFKFKLYFGKDSSYSQDIRPYVIFSPKFENLLNSNYIESRGTSKNITLVAGEGEGSSRRTTVVGDSSGLSRREVFSDARDISSRTENGSTISSSEYEVLLKRRGLEIISKYPEIVSFEGQIEYNVMFKLGEDFDIGDIVQIENEYGFTSTVRITEIVISENGEGRSIYPTFKTIS